MPPADVSKGPVKDVKLTGEHAVMTALPLITHCEKDAGPYLSSGVTIMRDPASGALNAGLYRHRVVSETRLTINMAPLSHGDQITREAEARVRALRARSSLEHLRREVREREAQAHVRVFITDAFGAEVHLRRGDGNAVVGREV